MLPFEVGLTARFARGVFSMAMQAESLEILEKAAVAPAQARAIVRAIEVEIAGARDTLATKHDLLLLKQDVRALGQDLRQEIAELAVKLRAEMAELAAKLRAEMAESAANLRIEIAESAATLRTEMAELRTEMAELRTEMAVLKGEMHAIGSGITRQMYLAILGQMSVLLGFSYFFATHMR